MHASQTPFDFWYAVNNTEVVLAPQQHLETFGATTINYRLVSELMDEVGRVRVREGRIQAYRPEILTPQSMHETLLEGFTDEAAGNYLQWLKEHESDLVILRYGFRIRKETTTESVLSDSVEAVLERVLAEMKGRSDPLAALVRGVEEPWEVCLLKLLTEVIRHSAPRNARDLRTDPTGARHEVEQAFLAAARNRAQLNRLAELLRKHDLFREYEDRFFALVKSLP